MYMLKPKAKIVKLRWRVTCIREWRKFRKFTLESAADALSRAPYGIKITHQSLGRIEKGKQLCKINLIEALAVLYRTDIESLLNRGPEIPDVPATAAGILQLWDKAASDERGVIIDVAKRVVKATH